MGRWGKDPRDWPLHQINELYRMVNEGKMTGSEIGGVLGKSRSAILGKCHRLELKMTKSKKLKPKDYLRFVPKAPPSVQRPPKIEKQYMILRDVPHENFLLFAGPFNCRWICGEPKAAIICGLPIARNSPYCPDHHRQSRAA